MSFPRKTRVAVILGTRPEAIKCAPVILAMRQSSLLEPWVISTAQHRDLLMPIFSQFKIHPDRELDVMRPQQTLSELSGRLILELGNLFQAESYQLGAVLVQGDTTTAFFGALTAFYHHIPVGHIEAGLRTGNLAEPFPEEANRRLIAPLAAWHFAPTTQAMRRLKQEGIATDSLHLTGNTIADAMRLLHQPQTTSMPQRPEKRLLVTCHRRESWGEPFSYLLEALKILARKNPALKIIFPLHPNPTLANTARESLQHIPQIECLSALPYAEFQKTLRDADVVLTDSGGVHEEAVIAEKPVILLRTQTERSEGLINRRHQLAGMETRAILRLAHRQLTQPFSPNQLNAKKKAFGDGYAAERIVEILERDLGEPPAFSSRA